MALPLALLTSLDDNTGPSPPFKSKASEPYTAQGAPQGPTSGSHRWPHTPVRHYHFPALRTKL